MESVDGDAVGAWAHAAATALEAARGPLDSLNVFPVADADTGTNLYLTIAQGADEVDALGPGANAARAMRAFARGALLGARGNSGVIASQFLLGLANSLPSPLLDCPVFDDAGFGPAALARALDEAQRAARAAVARPVEGTILTAATAAAAAAHTAARDDSDLGATSLAALRGAREALARTPDELAVLRAARVVDAGAAGLVVILEALVGIITGRPAPGTVPIAGRSPGPAGPPEEDPPDGEFEVMFLVESAAGDLAPELSRRLQGLGKSVAVVGGPGVWQAHVHTDDPAAAVAAGSVGTQRQITVRHLRAHGGSSGGPVAERLGVVVGTRAPALIRELARAGAVVMVLTGSPADAASVLRAVVDTGATQVAVLPGSPDAHAAAMAAAGAPASGRASTVGAGGAPVWLHVVDAVDDVRVVAGLAAVVAGRSSPPIGTTGEPADAVAHVALELAAIRAAVAGVRTAEVAGTGAAVARRVADDLLADGGEVLTMLRGAGADDAVLDLLLEHLADVHPGLEVVVVEGGQVSPALVLAVE